MLRERLVEGQEPDPRADGAEPVVRVDLDAVEPEHVDDDARAERAPLVVVTAAAHADPRALRASPADGAGDVAGRPGRRR